MADTVATSAGKVGIESPVGGLYPVIPQNTGRYDVVKKVKRSEMTISAGMFSARTLPQYLPEQWSPLTHPEGKPYFTREGSPRTVTSDNIYNSQVAEKITSWITRIHKEVASKGAYVPESAELFLQLEDDDCYYYFADHTARTVFWLEDYAAPDLGLLDVVSETNMKYQLEEQYWTHVDYHCMHRIPFQVNIVEEMIALLTHASGDQLTSAVSTFPYTFKECKRFLQLLIPARDRPMDGHIVSLVARIASVVAHNRYWTNHGQEQARLSRDSAILEEDERSSEWAAQASSAVTLKTADFFRNRLNTIFTDNYVYVTDWQDFMTAAMTKWRGAFTQSLGVLMLHVFCFFLPVSPPLAIGSATALASSMLASALLIHQHQDLEKANASAAFRYLNKHKKSSLGFTGLGLVMGLPQALNLYGLLLTFSQPFAILLDPSSYQVSVAFVALVALLSVTCGVKVLLSLLRGRTLTFASEAPSKESDASSV